MEDTKIAKALEIKTKDVTSDEPAEEVLQRYIDAAVPKRSATKKKFNRPKARRKNKADKLARRKNRK
jgi:hypothetical protein